jgi:uncharacterized membrane protein (DUF106 family)
MSVEQLSAFFGWMAVFNLILLSFAWLMAWIGRGWVIPLVRFVFPLPEEKIDEAVFRWLVYYELGWYVLNLVPWLALQMVKWST